MRPLAPAGAGALQATPAQREGAQPATDDDPLIGTTIGSFSVTRRLGLGGMGTVYLGEQAAIGSKVAIKVLHEHLATNPSLVQRFYAEARATNLIGHEHIVSIIDLSVLPRNRYYFVMEYLEGRALNELPRPMAAALVVHIMAQACDALQAAHANGVVHRDLKPENMILIRRGRNDQFLKILDFGIAKLFATELAGQKTMAGMIMGTPEFMAPEQTTGEPVDGRTDLYALGVIAYELVTGKLPFTGTNLADLLVAQRIQAAVPPHVLNPQVPTRLSDAIMRAMAKAPDARWQTADEFREALETSLSGAVMTGVEPRSRSKAPPGMVARGTPAKPRSVDDPLSGQTELSTWVEAFSEAPPPRGEGEGRSAPEVAPNVGRPADPRAAEPRERPGSGAPAEPAGGAVAPRPDAENAPLPREPALSPAWSFAEKPPSQPPVASPGSAPEASLGVPGRQGRAVTPEAVSPSARTESPAPVVGDPAKDAAPDGSSRARPKAAGPAEGGSSALGGSRSTPAPTATDPARYTPRGSQRGYIGAPSAGPSAVRAVFGSAPSSMSGPGARQGTPVPRGTPTPRPRASTPFGWSVKVFDQPKGASRVLRCTEVTRGGMFLQAAEGFPPVLSRLKVTVMLPDGELSLTVEVVQHVSAERAKAWNMPVGFGVQFVELTQAQRDDVIDLAKGRPRGSSGLHRPPEKDDPRAEELLAKYRNRGAASHYDFLGVVEDADFAEVRQRVRDGKKSLVDLRARPLSARQREQIDTLDKKLDEILLTIGQPRHRLDYDAQRGNWKGTARCIAGGVSVTDLDNARHRFLAERSRVEGTAHLHFTTGAAWESQKDFLRAQQEFERALSLDPLNLAFHQRYQALKRTMNAPVPPKRRS